MLDSFEIMTTSGVVLWSKSYASIGANIINSLIREVFIEDPGQAGSATEVSNARSKPSFKKDQYTLKWTTFRELDLIFVAVYQSLLHLSWIDKLLENVKTLFVRLYQDQLSSRNSSGGSFPFDDYFDQQIKELEQVDSTLYASRATVTESPLPSWAHQSERVVTSEDEAIHTTPQAVPELNGTTADDTRTSESTTVRPNFRGDRLLSASASRPGQRMSRRARKVAHQSAHASSGEESGPNKFRMVQGGQKKKKMRRWDADGLMDEDDQVRLDYSVSAKADPEPDRAQLAQRGSGNNERVQQDGGWPKQTSTGEFVLRDLDDEVHSILSTADKSKVDGNASTGIVGSGLGTLGGLFRNVVGGKVLTKADLDKPIKGMEEHLLKKNVAREAAISICEGVEKSLIGVKTGSFQSVETKLRTAMESSLQRILTPTSSLDLLREIQAVTAPSALSGQRGRPYVLSIVGVNGVGKSTNLSKICYFLLQNRYRVLIAACDTFRSGAVEQLRVHASNLRELGEREGGHVELYEKGYGKDAAKVAKEAIQHAAAHDFSVVLIDTAGRRHNDSRLMSSLEKFADLARPDKILMVGEALVGTDSVQQARNFNAAFGARRHLDGFIISKCDTVGDMIGTLISMVFATGIPVVFLGTGQHYSDLRTLNITWAVRLLMN